MATLNSKEIKERSKAKRDDGEGLYVKGKTNRRDSRQSRGKSRSKTQGERLKGSVQLGDNRECKIIGIDKVRIQLRDGSSFVLHNVRYIPELKRNLISMGTLEKEGYTVKLHAGKVKRVWVYILMFKHEAFGKFKEWKQLVENQTGRTVKKLRTNNGLEFCNREFEQLCIESMISRHLTVTGTPQQNGLAEHMNRFPMDK
nr:retrovirus-related Pol polyprotein from transposon TNT 1-94 [Tanacetum cinerariifolium]